jgi:hypothetical protein
MLQQGFVAHQCCNSASLHSNVVATPLLQNQTTTMTSPPKLNYKNDYTQVVTYYAFPPTNYNNKV